MLLLQSCQMFIWMGWWNSWRVWVVGSHGRLAASQFRVLQIGCNNPGRYDLIVRPTITLSILSAAQLSSGGATQQKLSPMFFYQNQIEYLN